MFFTAEFVSFNSILDDCLTIDIQLILIRYNRFYIEKCHLKNFMNRMFTLQNLSNNLS